MTNSTTALRVAMSSAVHPKHLQAAAQVRTGQQQLQGVCWHCLPQQAIVVCISIQVRFSLSAEHLGLVHTSTDFKCLQPANK
jgi:hypothetical protein